MKTNEWLNCYPSNWKGLIVDEAIVHPAKFSSKLIRRIYEHMIEMDWIHEGETVIDPFGGVALGALDAMRLGLVWHGCELEQRFVDLGNANIAHWNKRFSSLPKWSGDAVLFQGDSRELVRILGGNGQGVVSSPPYADSAINPGNVNNETINRWGQDRSLLDHDKDGYGQTDGNLGNMRGTEQGFKSAVSSPPYNLPMSQDHNGSRGGKRGTTPSEEGAFVKYGNTPGQLEGLSMTEQGFNAAISSPPYCGNCARP